MRASCETESSHETESEIKGRPAQAKDNAHRYRRSGEERLRRPWLKQQNWTLRWVRREVRLSVQRRSTQSWSGERS